MKINPTYRALLDKSLSSLLSAIEIYNKPNFCYREETFSILAVNAWELLFKAYILKINKFNEKSIYEKEPVVLKNGKLSEKMKKVKLNRCNNPMTISIFEAIKILHTNNLIKKNLKDNLETLIELRDNAIHFVNSDALSRQIQELGFGCIKNYINIVKEWDLPIDLSKYNLYLMPLAYVSEKTILDSVLSTEEELFVQYYKTKLEEMDTEDKEYDIAVKIDISFVKGNSINAIPFKKDINGIPVQLAEEDYLSLYPLTDKKLKEICKKRYVDFKQNKDFYALMRDIKKDEKFCHIRKLNKDNPKSAKQPYYSQAVINELDKSYTKK